MWVGIRNLLHRLSLFENLMNLRAIFAALDQTRQISLVESLFRLLALKNLFLSVWYQSIIVVRLYCFEELSSLNFLHFEKITLNHRSARNISQLFTSWRFLINFYPSYLLINASLIHMSLFNSLRSKISIRPDNFLLLYQVLDLYHLLMINRWFWNSRRRIPTCPSRIISCCLYYSGCLLNIRDHLD